MGRDRYRFRSEWHVAASVERVFAVLGDPAGYPRWWPQVRAVRGTEGDGLAGTAVFRSVLPFDLHVTGRCVRRDPAAGELGVALGGDLEGYVSWAVRPGAGGRGACVVFEQEVVVRKPLLRTAASVGRPFLRANHALMMRGGRRGLNRWLAAGFGEA